jgi:hypothetical protein
MILSPAPYWLPSLCQPADWLVAKILVILLIVGIASLIADTRFTKGGDHIG